MPSVSMGPLNTPYTMSCGIAEKHRAKGPLIFEQTANVGAGRKYANLLSPGEQATTWSSHCSCLELLVSCMTSHKNCSVSEEREAWVSGTLRKNVEGCSRPS